MHTTSTDTVADMITMFELEEFTILRNLYMRYKEKKIYVILIYFNSFVNSLISIEYFRRILGACL